jgi:hypothetical protein
MTQKEIEQTKPSDLSTNSWLREVCIQLALLNEKKSPGRPPNK